MTRLARVTRYEPGAVLAALAARVCSVVASNAVVDDRRVVDGRRQPRRSLMAKSAVVGRWNMVHLFSGGDDTVVARRSTRDGKIRLGVIHFHVGLAPCGQSRPRAQVAVLAQVRRRNMRERLGRRANSRRVAEHAIVGDAQFFVGKGRRNPCRRGVAKIAGFERWDVIRRLAGGIDSGDEHTERLDVVAFVAAIRNDFIVINRDSGFPRQRLMARIAASRCGRMNRRRGMARGGPAGPQYFVVINLDDGCPAGELMAGTAVRARNDVTGWQERMTSCRIAGPRDCRGNQVVVHLIRRRERARVVALRAVVT